MIQNLKSIDHAVSW